MTTFLFNSWEKDFWNKNNAILSKYFCHYGSFVSWFRWHFSELEKPSLEKIILERNNPKKHKSLKFRQIYLKRKKRK